MPKTKKSSTGPRFVDQEKAKLPAIYHAHRVENTPYYVVDVDGVPHEVDDMQAASLMSAGYPVYAVAFMHCVMLGDFVAGTYSMSRANAAYKKVADSNARVGFAQIRGECIPWATSHMFERLGGLLMSATGLAAIEKENRATV